MFLLPPPSRIIVTFSFGDKNSPFPLLSNLGLLRKGKSGKKRKEKIIPLRKPAKQKCSNNVIKVIFLSDHRIETLLKLFILISL